VASSQFFRINMNKIILVLKILNKFKKEFLNQRGSTIIELLIALMVVGLVVTAIVASGSYSIKNTGEARFKQVATTLAQEVIEKSRAEKNRLGFVNFKNIVGTNTYCFNTIPATFDSLTAGNCGASFSSTGASFTREVSFSNPESTIIEVEATVSWNDADDTRSVVLTQEFKQANF